MQGTLWQRLRPGGARRAARSVRVVLVDDQTMVRDGLRAYVSAEPDIDVVGDGPDGRAAVELAGRHRPDVLVLDAEVPQPQVVMAHVMEMSPHTRIILLTALADALRAAALLDGGARVLLVKDVPCAQLVAAIRSVMDGDDRSVVASSKRALDRALDQLRRLGRSAVLTDRQRLVLQLLARDVPPKRIAEEAHISEATVYRELSQACEVLGAETRLGAVLRAVGLGLIPPGVLDGAASVGGATAELSRTADAGTLAGGDGGPSAGR